MSGWGSWKMLRSMFDFFVPISNVHTFSDAFELATYYKNGSSKQRSYLFLAIFYFFLTCWICQGFVLNFYQNDFLATLYAYFPDPPTNMRIAKSAAAFAASEQLVTRCWLCYIHFKHPSKMEQFISLENIIQPPHRAKLLAQARVIIFIISFATPIIVPFYFFLYCQNATSLAIASGVIWSLMTLFLLRFHACDLITLYFYSYGLASSVYRDIFGLESHINSLVTGSKGNGHFAIGEVISEYLQVSNNIARISRIVSFLLFWANLLAIPLFSVACILLLQPTKNPFEKSFNVTLSLIEMVFTTRGYILTTYLSIVRTRARVLRSKILALLARPEFNSGEKRQFSILLDDLSSSKSRFAYKDASGTHIDQLDVLASFTRTAQMFLLSSELLKKWG